MLLELLKSFVNETILKSDKNTAMYILFAIKSFFTKLRIKMITLPRNIFNYWEVIVVNLCNDFLDNVCTKIYRESLVETCDEYKNIIKYVNREYFLDSFNCGDSTSLLSIYKEFASYEKKSYISIISNIGYIVFNYFEITNFMNQAELPFFDKIAINIGLIITVSQVLINFNNNNFTIDIKQIDRDMSIALLEFSSNVFIINESDNIDYESEKINKLVFDYFNESINKNYNVPNQINSEIITSDKFQSYLLSLIFSFTKYDYAVSEIVSGSFSSDLQTFKYYLSSLNNISLRRKIFDSKLKEIVDTPVLPITSEKVIFSCENLGVYFHDELIFKDFTCDFSLGEWVSLYGESGCGKTTLCNLILGRNKDYKGSLKFCGNDYNYFNIFEHVSFISPNGGIFKRTVRENCIYGVKHEVSDEKIKEYLDLFEMSDIELNSQADFLSTGQKQRIKVIRLLIHDRPFFFLDEITSNLDKKMGMKVIDEIRKVSRNKLVISITHDRSLIKDTDRVFTFNDNSILCI